MVRCEICGGEGAYFLCQRCNRKVCSKCFDQGTSLCIYCAEETREPLQLESLPQPFGRTVFLAIFLIMTGMLFMTAAPLISGSGGGGVIIIPPFIIGKVEGATALIIVAVMMVITLLVMLLPWIFGSGRVLRTIERMLSAGRPPSTEIGKAATSEDYIITLRMPGFKEEDIEIQAFVDSLTVRAYRNGRVAFTRTYSLPKETRLERVRYNCEDGFLIVRVTLKRKELGGEL